MKKIRIQNFMKAGISLCLIMLVFAFQESEQSTIKGKVIDKQSSLAIVGAKVFLLKDGKIEAQKASGKEGKFVFTNLEKGSYSFKVEANSYAIFKSKPFSIEGAKTYSKSISLHAIVNQQKIPELEIKAEVMDVQEESIEFDFHSRGNVNKRVANSSALGYANTGVYADKPYVEHNTESYDVINENTFKSVTDDPLSTFSVDVDRAAYANVRRFLNNNTKPHKDVVRIEELINYFDYKYPQPTDEHPFSVNMELAACPWNSDHQLALIGLQGKDVSVENIPNGNFVFLIDVSGSMSYANKLPLLKQAYKVLVNNLRPNDRVAIVVYAGAAGTVLESTPGSQKDKILAAIDRLQAGGSTAGGAGIKLAYKIAKENFIPNGNNRVILATDGDFNVGASSNAEMVRLIKEKRDEGVFLTICGFGMGNYKDSRMESISNAGNGNYFYIDNILEAKKAFGDELWGTLYTIAKDVKIQIEFNPAKVKGYRLIGYENRLLNKEDFNDDKKDAGEIGSGHVVTALYEIIPADSEEKINNVDPLEYQKQKVVDSKNIMTVKLRYKKPDEDVSNLIVKRITENDIRTKEMSENFKFAASIAEFGMLLRDSEHKGTATYASALTLAKQAKGEDEFGYRTEFIKLVEIASLLN
jgi:Ca-activated chloride channel homolog